MSATIYNQICQRFRAIGIGVSYAENTESGDRKGYLVLMDNHPLRTVIIFPDENGKLPSKESIKYNLERLSKEQ